MDFSKFSAEEFDVKDWINGVFRTQLKDDKQREAYTATLVTKLQRYIQEVNKSLEDISQQTIANFPRVLRDVETLKQEASFLWQQMQQVKEEIKSVEEQTSHSMEVLIRVDKVRTRVEQACDALKEADNWSSLASAVEDIFRSGDVNAISKQLQSMKTSLKVLKNSPDYEDKVLHLEALKNRLESLVSPNIVAAFMQNNLEESKKFYSIFKTLDRPNEIRNYYLKCHRARISTKWQEICSSEEKQNDRSLLEEFYDLLLSISYSEVQWCASIFGKETAVSIITQLILEVTLSVESGPASIINTAMTGLVTEKLTTLLKMCDITITFTVNLKKSISKDIQIEQIDNLMLSKLSDAFWHPYIPYFLQYDTLETETLLTSLSDVIMDAHDIIDLVQLLELSVNKVFNEAQEGIERCEKLTGHFGACDLIEALERFFSEYFDRFARQLRTIANSSGIKKIKIQNNDEDWSIFQHCIRVITTCGRIITKNIDFNQNLITSILTLVSDHDLDNLNSNDDVTLPWERYNYLKRVEPGKYSQLCELVSSAKENSVQILPKTKKRVQDLNQQAQNLAFDVAFAQVKRQLSSIPTTSSFSEESDDVMVAESEMPSFSVSPSEEATHVGQYLMTLPQHLEPFSIAENAENSESQSLETALRNGSLPFPAEPGESAIENEFENLSDQWLGAIVRATEHTYIEAITKIPSLNSSGAKQLVSDLDYMANVIDSLGLSPSTKLHHLRSLLNVPTSNKDEFKECCAKAPHKLAIVIANMRHINIEN